jgi:hypothetical protein
LHQSLSQSRAYAACADNPHLHVRNFGDAAVSAAISESVGKANMDRDKATCIITIIIRQVWTAPILIVTAMAVYAR